MNNEKFNFTKIFQKLNNLKLGISHNVNILVRNVI